MDFLSFSFSVRLDATEVSTLRQLPSLYVCLANRVSMTFTLSWRQAAVAALLFNAAVTANYDTRRNNEASEDTKRALNVASVKARGLNVRNFVQKLDVDSVLSALGSNNKAQGSSCTS